MPSFQEPKGPCGWRKYTWCPCPDAPKGQTCENSQDEGTTRRARPGRNAEETRKLPKLDGKSKEHLEPGGDVKTGTKRGQGDGHRKMSRPRTVREKHQRRREGGWQKSRRTVTWPERSRRRHTERARNRPESDRAAKTKSVEKGGQRKETEHAETRRQRRRSQSNGGKNTGVAISLVAWEDHKNRTCKKPVRPRPSREGEGGQKGDVT